MLSCFSRPPKECSICLCNIGLFEEFQMPCRHAYHRSCILSWLARKNSCPECRAPACKYITMGLKVYNSTVELRGRLDKELQEKFKGHEYEMRRIYGIGAYTLDSKALVSKNRGKAEYERILRDNIAHRDLLDNMLIDDWCALVRRLFRFGGCYSAGFLDGLNSRLELVNVPEKQLMKELLKRSSA